jgi:hypothetical protein
MGFRENRDRLHFWREEHLAASKGFAFASLLAQASIASRCQFRFAGKEREETSTREEQFRRAAPKFFVPELGALFFVRKSEKSENTR